MPVSTKVAVRVVLEVVVPLGAVHGAGDGAAVPELHVEGLEPVRVRAGPVRARPLRACLAIKWGKKEHSDNFPIMVARNNVNRPSHAHGPRPEP